MNRPDLGLLARELGPWRSEDVPESAAAAEILKADNTIRRCFHRSDGAEVWVFVAYFGQQQVNSQIHSPRNCLPGSGWNVVSLARRTLTLEGAPQTTTHMRILRNGRSQDLYYWFRTRRGSIAGEYALKWDLVKSSLARVPTDAAFVRYNALSGDSLALRDVMNRFEGSLDQVLGGAGL